MQGGAGPDPRPHVGGHDAAGTGGEGTFQHDDALRAGQCRPHLFQGERPVQRERHESDAGAVLVDGITLAQFRDALGVGRKSAQLYLERFDADGVTRRVGDSRVLRRR